LTAARKLVADSGPFVISGKAIALSAARKLGIGRSNFVLYGSPLTFEEIEKLSIAAESGSFSLHGSVIAMFPSRGESGDWKDWKNQKPWAVTWADKWGYLNNPAWMRPSAPVSYTGNEANEPQAWTVVHKNKWGYLNNPRWKDLADD
jgi:hypothetical protein